MMKSNLLVLVTMAAVALLARAQPEFDLRLICPIHGQLNEFNSTEIYNNNTRIIDLGKIVGKRLQVQFYSPNPAKAVQQRHFEEATTLAALDPYLVVLDDTTPPFWTPGGPHGGLLRDGEEATTTEAEVATTLPTTTTESSDLAYDVLCHWEFVAANVSEYILLTFHDMSAPYSPDCVDAYVALQKDNGYESRWCGNRRQPFGFGPILAPGPAFGPLLRFPRSASTDNIETSANARPMSLVSKTKARVSLFRRGNSSAFPPTGFTLTVESLDIFGTPGAGNAFRVLLG